MNHLLFDESPLVVQRSLARLIGLDEAVMTQQLHYWLLRSGKWIEGRPWVYNSIPDWHKQFDWLSETTVKRKIEKLVKGGIWLVGEHNKKSFDRTNWYTLDYEKLFTMCPVDQVKMTRWAGQNGQAQVNMTSPPDQNGPPHQVSLTPPIPENTQRLTHETSHEIKPPTPTTHARPGEIWLKILEILEMKISAQTFNTWFKPTTGIEFDDNWLIVAVPDEFYKDWIESRYAVQVKEAAVRVMNCQEIGIKIVIRKLPQEQ